MNVVFLFPNFFFIGAQRATAATIRELDRTVFRPFVIVVDSFGNMQDEIPEDVEIHTLPNDSMLTRVPFFRIFYWPFQLRKLLYSLSADCVVSICPQTNFTLVLYKLFFRKSPIFIGEEHQHLSNAIKNDPSDFRRPWKYLYNFSLRNYHRLDHLRCVSNSAARDFELNWGVPSEKITTIYPAFDLNRIAHRAHGKKAINDIPVVCSVGRLTAQKDFSFLIQAFAIVLRSIPATLRIAGVGPQQEQLLDLVAQLGLGNSVELLGFVEFAEEVIASSDLFVMTSVWEGFPATIVEAMVLGTTVVSVDCESGPAELIQHGVNGCLVKEKTAEGVAREIIDLLSDPVKRLKLSENARKSVQHFSLKNTVSEMQNLIHRLN